MAGVSPTDWSGAVSIALRTCKDIETNLGR